MINNRIFLILSAATLLSCGERSSTGAPTHPPDAGRAQHGIATADLNAKAAACDDFYQYANGAWIAANRIPAGKSRWSRRAIAREENKRELQAILTDVSGKKDWPTASGEQLIGDHFASCMNETSVDAAGVTPLKPLLTEIDKVRSAADVQRVIRLLHEMAVPVVFSVVGSMDNAEPTNFIANITAGGVGLADRDFYLKTDDKFVRTLQKYRLHVARIFKLSGMSDAQAEKGAADVVAFEKRLADASLDGAHAADPAATDHKMTFAQLQQLTPHIDWIGYFDAAKLPRVDLNVAEPKFLQQVDKELSATSVAVWKSYLAWRLLDSAAPFLSRPFVDESADFSEAFLKGATEKKPRAVSCLESTDELFGEPLARKYVALHFPPAAKAKAQEVARSMLAVLKEDVDKLTWMDPQTKKQALEKLATYNVQIGYPDNWPDKWKDSAVAIHRDTFWENIVAARKYTIAIGRKQIGKPTDRNLWQLTPSSPDAYLDLQLNEIVLPAGFLQPPLFDPNATDAVIYGSFGAGLAHDMTHSIDAGGADLDLLGRPKNWWTDKDRSAFQQRGQCVVDQYEGYFIEPGIHHNGKLVLSESIGDLTGVRIAYRTLEKSVVFHPVPTLDGFTPEQQFFIAWGQYRGDAMTLEGQRQLVKSDPHPTPKYRVIGPLANMPEFQHAFSCQTDAPMVRPPDRRCAVW